MRRFGLFGHGLAKPAGHGVEPLADGLRQFRLTGTEHLGNCPNTSLHFGLGLQYAGHTGLGVASVVGGFGGSLGTGLARAPQGYDERSQRKEKHESAKDQGLTQCNRGRTKPDDRFG